MQYYLLLNDRGINIKRLDLANYWLRVRTCMKTECVISGTTGGLMDPNYCVIKSADH